MADSRPPLVRPRLRAYRGKDVILGPGKAELLGLIEETGSLREAARAMKMSYMKAWSLVQLMNRSFRSPLVSAERGGSRGGGATLTEAGKTVLGLYREMDALSLAAIQRPARQLERMLAVKRP